MKASITQARLVGNSTYRVLSRVGAGLPHRPLRRMLGGALLVSGTMVLAACGRADEAELRGWMAEQQRLLGRAVAADAAPPAPEPAAYTRVTGLDPFDARRLSDRPVARSALVPARADLPLVAHPLSSLRMVGSLRQGDEVVALIQAELQIFQVPVGAALDLNRARVLRISEDGVTVREMARGPRGEPRARTVVLPLQGR